MPLHERFYGDPSLIPSHEDTGRKSWLWHPGLVSLNGFSKVPAGARIAQCFESSPRLICVTPCLPLHHEPVSPPSSPINNAKCISL